MSDSFDIEAADNDDLDAVAVRVDAKREKPRLKIERSHPERTVADLRDILAACGRLYDRGTPARVAYDQMLAGSIAHGLSADSLILEAHFACQPYALTHGAKDAERPAPLPPQIARMYLGWKGEWGLPPLNGITSAPLLAEDGSIRTARGYDAATGLWCEDIPDVAELVPPKPTKVEAEAALKLVRDFFKTFCFADADTIAAGGHVRVVDLRKPPGLDESSFLASLLGAVCRACLWLAPGYLYRAAQHSGSGAGKGKLARCVCAVAYGRQPAAVTSGDGSEEFEKRIAAALLEGGPAVLFDNLNNITLHSALLESILTERPAKVRQFRTLDLIALDALASVFVTGNGVLLSRDLVRRFIPTEFDAGMEDPEQRRFSGDILAQALCRRRDLLAALLTIWRYGRVAGPEKQGGMLGSYEQWCAWVRDPLLSLGCRDPVDRLAEMKARDPFRQTVTELFRAWWRRHGPSPQRAHELDVEVQKIVDPQGRGRQFVAAQLEKLAGTRLAGFVLTRQRGSGIRSTATYALHKNGVEGSSYTARRTHADDTYGTGNFTDSPHDTRDAHALRPYPGEKLSSEPKSEQEDRSEAEDHVDHAHHAADMGNGEVAFWRRITLDEGEGQ